MRSGDARLSVHGCAHASPRHDVRQGGLYARVFSLLAPVQASASYLLHDYKKSGTSMRRLYQCQSIAQSLAVTHRLTGEGTGAACAEGGGGCDGCRRWLLGLLILQSTSSMVLDKYEGLLKEHLFVTLFLTMLVGAGGNAGNQSAIKVIRGLVCPLHPLIA